MNDFLEDYYQEYCVENPPESELSKEESYKKGFYDLKVSFDVLIKEYYKLVDALKEQADAVEQLKRVIKGYETYNDYFKEITQKIYLAATDRSLTRNQIVNKVHRLIEEQKTAEEEKKPWLN